MTPEKKYYEKLLSDAMNGRVKSLKFMRDVIKKNNIQLKLPHSASIKTTLPINNRFKIFATC